MTHALTLPLPPAVDPIHAAIARHRAAWSAFQVAPEGDPSLEAEDECDAARAALLGTACAALLGTACATRFGALALLDHLRWWLAEEAPNAEAYGDEWSVAHARAADLMLFLGTRLPPIAIPRAAPCGRLAPPTAHRLLPAPDRYRQNAPSALPNEPLPGEGEPWAAAAPVRPDTVHVLAPRFADLAGEALAFAALLIVGGYLVGVATLL